MSQTEIQPGEEFRERVERWEAEFLSARATRSYPAARRREEPDSPVRTPFQRDRDRIAHSKAFRRLKHKTQVFIAPEGDHYRTRLTHTLETCFIARTVARALGAERGPDRGDRARARPRPPAVRSHRRGGARPGAARARRRGLSPQPAFAADGRRARARGGGAQPDRTGARRDPQPHRPDTAGDARGPGREAGRPGRLHQPRHRRRRPRRHPRRVRPAGEADRPARPDRHGADRHSRARHRRQLPRRATRSPSRRRSAGRCCACASSCSTRSTSGRRPAASTTASIGRSPGSSTTTSQRGATSRRSSTTSPG